MDVHLRVQLRSGRFLTFQRRCQLKSKSLSHGQQSIYQAKKMRSLLLRCSYSLPSLREASKLQSFPLPNKSRLLSTVNINEETGTIKDGGERKSWIPVSNQDLQRITIQSLIHEVAERQRELASKVVPWYLRNMPASYFRHVPENIRSQHIKAITAIHELSSSDLSLKIETKSMDGSITVTYITSQTKTGALHSQIQGLVIPSNCDLANVQVFSSVDGELALNIFTFAPVSTAEVNASVDDMAAVQRYAAAIKRGEVTEAGIPKYDEKIFGEAALEAYRKRIRPEYAAKADPRRFLIMREMYERVRDNDAASVHMEVANDQNARGFTSSATASQMAWISIATANVLPEVLLRLCSAIISARGLNVIRVVLDKIDNPESSSPEIPGSVTMLRILVSDTMSQVDMNPESAFMSILRRDLKRSKWLDNETTNLGLQRFPAMGLDKAEVITALCSMVHGPLYKENSQAYASIKSIIELITSHPRLTAISEEISSLFLQRFDPSNPLDDARFEARCNDIVSKIHVLQFDSARVALQKILNVVKAVLRTNFHSEDRYALSLRVKPNIMVSSPTAVEPYGVFFIHGRHFNAFHCRFRDIARGGLRIVTPQNSDQFALESSRLFDEAYSLSYAQQLKNKDIPEGGAKGVILVNTPSIESSNRFFAMRKAVKGFADSMLDLTVQNSVAKLVDHYGKDELIYLGPDEQIIPSDIDWITQRAAERGYPIPAAFMSSKKDAGFNHKEFGVTSEGVVVYLDVALRKALKIDPKRDPFSIKLTGGPDGDVAGNLIRILFRDYRDTCKIVGVADGFGVAEDPNGLDPSELLRLVKESLPISSFSPGKLSPQGVCLSASTDEGMVRRNTMHFRVKADAFVPAGGRPNTINADNWHLFLDENSVPSSPLIVEGANIFITADARTKLFEVGKVAIVKDSSANKCGVITSSCEVAASMLLSKKEFMDIKAELVEDVLHNLRNLARLEGELLFREYQNYPGQLPQFSERISLAIAKVTDAITDTLADVQPSDPLFQELLPLIRENLPKKLADVAGDRIATSFPVQYQRNAIASNLASMLVYKEGIHLIETQPQNKIAERAVLYYRAEKNVKALISSIETLTATASTTTSTSASTSTPEEWQERKAMVLDVLKRGGARTLLNIF